MSDSGWSVEWYTPNDTVLIKYWGFLTDEIVLSALDYVLELLKDLSGELKVYCIVDQREVLELNPNTLASAALHDTFFHPCSGKMYLVANEQQTRWMNDIFNTRRPDSVRIANSVEEAAAEIAKRRAMYRTRQHASSQPQADGTWETLWYRENDVALMIFKGYFSAAMLNAAMNKLGELLDAATGDLRIYIISDESQVSSFEPDLHVQAVLHPAYFHPRGGAVYVVGTEGELYAANEAFAEMRQGAIRLMNTREEAVADIDKRRAAYFAKKNKEN